MSSVFKIPYPQRAMPLLLVVLMLAGCADDPEPSNEYRAHLSGPRGAAHIIVYRLETPPHALPVTFSIDGQSARMLDSHFTCFDVPPGTHQLVAKWRADAVLPETSLMVSAHPGETKCVQLRSELGPIEMVYPVVIGAPGESWLTELPLEQAEPDLGMTAFVPPTRQ